MTTVSSTSDERTVNNVMRHEYRVLAAENEWLKAGANDTMQAQHAALLELQRENDQLLARCERLERALTVWEEVGDHPIHDEIPGEMPCHRCRLLEHARRLTEEARK